MASSTLKHNLPTSETLPSSHHRGRAPDWTEEEIVSLLEAVRVYGNDWKRIQEDPNFSKRFHEARTTSSLKTKWFNIKNVPGFKLNCANTSAFARKIKSTRNIDTFPTPPASWAEGRGDLLGKRRANSRCRKGLVSPATTQMKIRNRRLSISFKNVHKILSHRFVDVSSIIWLTYSQDDDRKN
jgi:hypothetical protein